MAVVKFDSSSSLKCWLACPQPDAFKIGKAAFEVNHKERCDDDLPSWRLIIELAMNKNQEPGDKKQVFIEHFDMLTEV